MITITKCRLTIHSSHLNIFTSENAWNKNFKKRTWFVHEKYHEVSLHNSSVHNITQFENLKSLKNLKNAFFRLRYVRFGPRKSQFKGKGGRFESENLLTFLEKFSVFKLFNAHTKAGKKIKHYAVILVIKTAFKIRNCLSNLSRITGFF